MKQRPRNKQSTAGIVTSRTRYTTP